MPSKSKSQQRLMGLAYAYKKKKVKSLNKKYAKKVKKLAKSMSLKNLKDFASTKHDRLPERIAKNESFILDFSSFIKE